jgi:hypothetical protein
MANFLLRSEKVQTADSNQCWQEVRGLVIWAFCSNPSATEVFLYLYQPGHFFFQRYKLNLSNMKLSIRTCKSKKICINYMMYSFSLWNTFRCILTQCNPIYQFLPCASKLRFVPDDFRTLKPKTPSSPRIYWKQNSIFVKELLILNLVNSMPLVITDKGDLQIFCK